MKYPKEYLDEIKLRLKVSQVVGKSVQLKKRGKEFVGLSPFKNEKSPSFTVSDEKEFYHCFSTGEHGNIFDFLMKTKSLGFGEAVKELAIEAGMPQYKFSTMDTEKEKRFNIYKNIFKEYSDFFHQQLFKSENNQALSYLEKRGLNQSIIKEFNLGYVPWQNNFYEKLLIKFSEEEITLTGLYYKNEKTNKFIDRFNSRIIFPINNLTNETIAFGGRIIRESQLAKYINSPESSLFDKGRTLYNHKNARDNLKKANHLIVAEGYMDVIALTAAGFNAAVAPLGTAITESQLRMMWRLTDEPVIALDGDQAGINAAMRAIDLALPLLTIGKSLRFAVLPQGQDPDDIIKSDGKERLKEIIQNAVPMIDLLWQRALEGQNLDSPDRRAAFDASLKNITKKILEPTIRNHYFAALKAKRSDLLRTTGITKSNIFTKNKKNTFATIGAKSSTLATKSSDEKTVKSVRDVVIFAILFTHPELMKEFSYRLERMELQNKQILQNNLRNL